MAVAVGHIDVPAISAGAGPQTLVYNALPWKPQAVKMWGTSSEPSHTVDTYFDAWQAFSVGFATDDFTAQYAMIEGARSVGDHSFQNAGSSSWDDILYGSIHTEYETTPDITVAIRSWDCFGWTFTVAPVGTAAKPAFRLYFIAYSGKTLSRKAGQVTVPASGAGATVTVGFEPQLIEFMSYYNPVRDKHWRGGAATPDFQGFETFHAYEFGSGVTPGNGGGYQNGTGMICDLGITVASFDATGFTLAGVPPADLTFQYLALADPDASAGFWAGASSWPTVSTDYTTGFQPEAVTALHTGGKNGDRLGRVGFGAVDKDGNAGAIFGQVFTGNPADPTGVFSTGDDHRGEATLTDSSLAILYQTDGSTLATQDVTFDTTKITLSGSDPGSHPEHVLLTAVATSEPAHCVSVVSASRNTYAHKSASVTSLRAS
jgi:hypothetical protein